MENNDKKELIYTLLYFIGVVVMSVLFIW